MNSIDTLHLAMASARPQEMREAAPASSSIQQWRLLHVFRSAASTEKGPTNEIHRPRNTARHRDGTDNRNPPTKEHASHRDGTDNRNPPTKEHGQPLRWDRQSKIHRPRSTASHRDGPTIEIHPLRSGRIATTAGWESVRVHGAKPQTRRARQSLLPRFRPGPRFCAPGCERPAAPVAGPSTLATSPIPVPCAAEGRRCLEPK